MPRLSMLYDIAQSGVVKTDGSSRQSGLDLLARGHAGLLAYLKAVANPSDEVSLK